MTHSHAAAGRSPADLSHPPRRRTPDGRALLPVSALDALIEARDELSLDDPYLDDAAGWTGRVLASS